MSVMDISYAMETTGDYLFLNTLFYLKLSLG